LQGSDNIVLVKLAIALDHWGSIPISFAPRGGLTGQIFSMPAIIRAMRDDL
jgi:hypothetical protein